MDTDSLAEALEREHQQIDAGIAEYDAAPSDPEPLTRAIAALRRHIYIEEEFLFPLLGEAEPQLKAPVFVMLREHAQMWTTLEAIDHALAADPAALPGLKQELTVQLLHHNLKEEKIIYPRTAVALSPKATERLEQLLSGEAAVTVPEGWVSFKSRPNGGGGPTPF